MKRMTIALSHVTTPHRSLTQHKKLQHALERWAQQLDVIDTAFMRQALARSSGLARDAVKLLADLRSGADPHAPQMQERIEGAKKACLVDEAELLEARRAGLHAALMGVSAGNLSPTSPAMMRVKSAFASGEVLAFEHDAAIDSGLLNALRRGEPRHSTPIAELLEKRMEPAGPIKLVEVEQAVRIGVEVRRELELHLVRLDDEVRSIDAGLLMSVAPDQLEAARVEGALHRIRQNQAPSLAAQAALLRARAKGNPALERRIAEAELEGKKKAELAVAVVAMFRAGMKSI